MLSRRRRRRLVLCERPGGVLRLGLDWRLGLGERLGRRGGQRTGLGLGGRPVDGEGRRTGTVTNLFPLLLCLLLFLVLLLPHTPAGEAPSPAPGRDRHARATAARAAVVLGPRGTAYFATTGP